MTTLENWQINREVWQEQDLSLMAKNDGWHLRTKKKEVSILQRSFEDDKNDLFKWRLPNVAANHKQVFDVFTNKMVDYHHYWTAEYSGGYVVKDLDNNAQIVYQQFSPNIPFVAKRDLLYVQ
jgi:hypothetical protein